MLKRKWVVLVGKWVKESGVFGWVITSFKGYSGGDFFKLKLRQVVGLVLSSYIGTLCYGKRNDLLECF